LAAAPTPLRGFWGEWGRKGIGSMLAADKLLLQSNVKQRAIQLREKELNLFNDKCALLHCAHSE